MVCLNQFPLIFFIFFESYFSDKAAGLVGHNWPSMAKWIGALDLGSFVREDEGSNPSVPYYLVWDGGQWNDSKLSRVDPALNGYMEKSWKGKKEGCAKAHDCTSWLKGLETDISTTGSDLKGLAPYPSPLPFLSHNWIMCDTYGRMSFHRTNSNNQISFSWSLVLKYG